MGLVSFNDHAINGSIGNFCFFDGNILCTTYLVWDYTMYKGNELLASIM